MNNLVEELQELLEMIDTDVETYIALKNKPDTLTWIKNIRDDLKEVIESNTK